MLSSSSNLQTDPSQHIDLEGSNYSKINHRRFALKSNNVILEDYFEPVEAIILIQDGKIEDVIIPKRTDLTVLNQIQKDWEVQDYGNLFIFPGLIDCNVHLHSDFGEGWENIEYATKLAASGGVTTIVDNPIMTKVYTSDEDYVESLHRKIDILKVNSKVDFGIFGILEPKTKNIIGKMLEMGIMGFKCYLLNCPQETVRHFSPEVFSQVVKELDCYPDLFLMIHPEIATERELYLSSPCRMVALEKRLDMKHVIKSIELGGAANRGSYLDELCKKSSQNSTKDGDEEDDDDDDDCPSAKLDTPSKLRHKVKRTQEKTEIDDIVRFELLSYGYNNVKNEPVAEDSSDSDAEITKVQKELANNQKMSMIPINNQVSDTNSLKNITNENFSSGIESEKSYQNKDSAGTNTFKTENTIPNYSIKKSTFARPRNQLGDAIKELDIESRRDDMSVSSTIGSKHASPEKQHITEIDTSSQFENRKLSINSKPLNLNFKLPVQKSNQSTESAKGSLSTPGANKTLTQTRKMLSFFAATDVKETLEKSNTSSPNPSPGLIANYSASKIQNKENLNQSDENHEAKLFFAANYGSETVSVASSQISCSPKKTEIISSHSSSLPNNSVTPAGSSLLMRRMSRRPLQGIAVTPTSVLSSPSTDFSKVNSLNVIKSSSVNAKKEAKYNHDYRVFLANRPQSWEENAVTLVLAHIHAKTNLRVMLPNLSLASSFLKIRDKKKSNESFISKIYGDSSAAYLFFNEKMIKNGETKYKVSPPFRNKENRRLLVENLRLGGIDIMSSYHFYVPLKFKQVDEGNFRRAFGGINSIGNSLQSAWTAVYSHQMKTNKKFNEDPIYQRTITNHILRQMYKTMAYNPAHMLKISERKGIIAKGRDADFVIWDPYRISNNTNLGDEHIFVGKTVMGTVYKTYLRGDLIFDFENEGIAVRGYVVQFLKS